MNSMLSLSTLTEKLKQTKYSFVYDEKEENVADEMVAIYFLSKDEKTVIQCTLITLVFEYQVALLSETERIFYENHPTLKEQTYEDMTEKFKDEYDELLEDVHASGDIKVQEFLSEVEDDVWEYALNCEILSEEEIESFVKDFKNQQVKIDSNLYQFEIFDEE